MNKFLPLLTLLALTAGFASNLSAMDPGLPDADELDLGHLLGDFQFHLPEGLLEDLAGFASAGAKPVVEGAPDPDSLAVATGLGIGGGGSGGGGSSGAGAHANSCYYCLWRFDNGSICNQKTDSPRALAQHLQTHTGEKSYASDIYNEYVPDHILIGLGTPAHSTVGHPMQAQTPGISAPQAIAGPTTGGGSSAGPGDDNDYEDLALLAEETAKAIDAAQPLVGGMTNPSTTNETNGVARKGVAAAETARAVAPAAHRTPVAAILAPLGAAATAGGCVGPYVFDDFDDNHAEPAALAPDNYVVPLAAPIAAPQPTAETGGGGPSAHDAALAQDAMARRRAASRDTGQTDATPSGAAGGSSNDPIKPTRKRNATTTGTVYQCGHCKYRGRYASDVRKHERIHTGENPFPCTHPGCPKSFKTSSHLNVHKRIHTGERPFPCTFEGCDKRFSQKGTQERHLRTHTGEKRFSCTHPACGQSFIQKGNLERHVRTKHPSTAGGGGSAGPADDSDDGSDAEEDDDGASDAAGDGAGGAPGAHADV